MDNGPPMSSLDDAVSNLKNIVLNLSALNSTIQLHFPVVSGTFTLANATVTVVTQPAIAANSKVFFTPTNAAGALTMATFGLFHATNTAATSFSVSTQGGSATGTEQFEYVVF